MNLAAVSRTAILTLVYRVIETEKGGLGFHDPMAAVCLDGLLPLASAEERSMILALKRTYSSMPRYRDVRGALARTMLFDGLVSAYLADRPGCTIVDLACGFDTRYWRIKRNNCRYIELDLPAVIELKRKIFPCEEGHEYVGASVLDSAWIEGLSARRSGDFLLVAEGLLCYLPEGEVVRLLGALARGFPDSRFIFDVLSRVLTKGPARLLSNWSFKHFLGADTAWVFGLRGPADIEDLSPGIRLLEVRGTGGLCTILITAFEGGEAHAT
jgi:O-methyltransferase involved in polyketide biosynthesis